MYSSRGSKPRLEVEVGSDFSSRSISGIFLEEPRPTMSKSKKIIAPTPSETAPARPSGQFWWLLLLPLGSILWWRWPSGPQSSFVAPPRPTEASVSATDPALWFDRSAPFAQIFVGSVRCQSCHTAEHASWSLKAHSVAMQEATSQTILGDFRDVTFEGDGISAMLTQEGARFFVETPNAQGQNQKLSVDYVLGSKRSQEYLTQLPDGRLQILPLSYSIKAKRWFAPLSLTIGVLSRLSPFSWTNARRTFNRECFDCHLTGMETRYDTEQDRYQTQWVELGVSCEACHGPGKQHAEAPSKANILNPNALSQDRQLALCGRCHSSRTMHFSLFNSEHSFFPGDLYEDYFSPVNLGQLGPKGGPSFYPDARPKESGAEYQALLQSRCYQRSGMTCSTCHSEHNETSPASNVLCGGCHTKELQALPQHSKHSVEGQAGQCVSCHMPKLISTLAGFTTDHTIDIPNPDNTRDYDIPSACVQCHSDHPASWASKQFRFLYGAEALSRRSGLAKMFLTAGEPKEAKQVKEKLIFLLQDSQEAPLLRAVAASALSGYRDPLSVAALADALTDPAVWVRASAAVALATLGKDRATQVATHALIEALQDRSLWVRMQAATSLYAFGEPRGRAFFESLASEGYQNWYRVRAFLALNAVQRNLLDIAQEEIRVTLLDKPDFLEMYRLLSKLFLQQNQPELAKEPMRKLLRFDPSDPEAQKILTP
jgi:hypothetical protein